MKNILLFIVFSVIYYIVGSVNWALVIGKYIYKTDVREYGSGNLGATNAGRVLGMNVAIAVTVLDAVKGALAFWILSLINSDIAILACPFASVGHCYPVFAKFKGGKGVSTTFGLMLAITIGKFSEFVMVFIVSLLIWLLIKKETDLVSLGSLTSVLIGAVLSTFVCENVFKSLAITLLWILMMYRHKENVIRLINGKETKADY